MDHKELIRDVLRAAGEFNGRQLWKRFTNFDCFAVRISDRGEVMLGVVLGDAGEEYGLSLFRGPGAAADFAALLDPDGPGDDSPEIMDLLGFSMEVFGEGQVVAVLDKTLEVRPDRIMHQTRLEPLAARVAGLADGPYGRRHRLGPQHEPHARQPRQAVGDHGERLGIKVPRGNRQFHRLAVGLGQPVQVGRKRRRKGVAAAVVDELWFHTRLVPSSPGRKCCAASTLARGVTKRTVFEPSGQCNRSHFEPAGTKSCTQSGQPSRIS